MKKKATCPTCGSKLGKLHDPNLWRTCTSCERTNPRQYLYCGWCASPMENTEMRRKLTDVATPPGGWPSLASELVEVRFFMDRGNFADAFELLSILRQRYPLHPELEEFTERTRRSPPPDTDVHRVVDGVLADSTSLNGALPRRAAPKWQAPNGNVGPMPLATGSHQALDPNEFADTPAPLRKGLTTARGHTPIASIPVVPVIPPEARVARPKKKKPDESKKRRPKKTKKYQRAALPVNKTKTIEHDQPVARGKTVETETVPVEMPPTHTPAPVVAKAPLVPAPAPKAGAVLRTSGSRDVDESAYTAPQEIPPQSHAAGTLYSEPETEAALDAAAHAERLAAATQEIASESERRDAERSLIEAARMADAERAAQRAEEDSERARVAEEARRAVEDAVSEIPDRPGAQTGSTHVGPAPLAPTGVTGDTAVGGPPKPPVGLDADPPTVPHARAVLSEPTPIAPHTPMSLDEPETPTLPRARAVRVEDKDPPVRAESATPAPVRRRAPEVKVETPAPPLSAVTGETVVGMPPSATDPAYVPPRGMTVSVDALQPPAPFEDPAGKKSRKRGRGGQGRKRSMKARKRTGKTTPVGAEQQPQQQNTEQRQEKVRRRAARFGQGVLGK